MTVRKLKSLENGTIWTNKAQTCADLQFVCSRQCESTQPESGRTVEGLANVIVYVLPLSKQTDRRSWFMNFVGSWGSSRRHTLYFLSRVRLLGSGLNLGIFLSKCVSDLWQLSIRTGHGSQKLVTQTSGSLSNHGSHGRSLIAGCCGKNTPEPLTLQSHGDLPPFLTSVAAD